MKFIVKMRFDDDGDQSHHEVYDAPSCGDLIDHLYDAVPMTGLTALSIEPATDQTIDVTDPDNVVDIDE